MSSEAELRVGLVELARAVMDCEHCRSPYRPEDLAQPGWIGNRYRPGHGVVIVLQNPAAASTKYGTHREDSVQHLLREFKAHPSIESHEQLMRFIFADMAGEDPCGRPVERPWAKWKHPISKLVSDREKLAWMNVVKFRTPGKKRKDDPVTRSAARHGLTEHLQHELKILKPRGIVTIGKEACSSLRMLRLPSETVLVGHLKLQGASTVEAKELNRRLLDAGVDV
jgi:uracil-DNA glycosylase